jgi:hypothetical protein
MLSPEMTPLPRDRMKSRNALSSAVRKSGMIQSDTVVTCAVIGCHYRSKSVHKHTAFKSCKGMGVNLAVGVVGEA